MRDWLMQAAERGDVVRQERPVRYTLPEEKNVTEKANGTKNFSEKKVAGQNNEAPELFD